MSDLMFDRLSTIDQIVRGTYQPGETAEVPSEAEPKTLPTEPPPLASSGPPVAPVESTQFTDIALAQAGDTYVWGAGRGGEDDPAAFDCSGLVYFAARKVGVRVGGTAFDQWQQTRNDGTTMSVEEALRTPGALLFSGDGSGSGRGAITHVAISLGDGRTIEARGRAYGVMVVDAATNRRRFNFAGTLPGLGGAGARPSPAPKAVPSSDDLMSRLGQINKILGGR